MPENCLVSLREVFLQLFLFFIKCTVWTNSIKCLALHVTIHLLNLSLKTSICTRNNTGCVGGWGLGRRRKLPGNAGLALAVSSICTKHYNFLETPEGSRAEIFTTTSNCCSPSPLPIPQTESHRRGRVNICPHLHLPHILSRVLASRLTHYTGSTLDGGHKGSLFFLDDYAIPTCAPNPMPALKLDLLVYL